MAQESFDEVLRSARQLSPVEKQRLIDELSRHTALENGSEAAGKSVGDALRELGFIGALTDAPADLATNPKYMEGFGEHAD